MMKIPTILHNLFPSRNNSSNSSLILSSPNDGPTDNDVLCGRDRNFSKHPGNVLYRIQVEKYASAYALATTKQSKMKITKQIVHIMQSQYGSRFLRRVTAATATTNAVAGRNSNSANTSATTPDTHNNNNCNSQWEVLTNIQARDKTSHALRFINNNNSSTSSSRTDDDASSSAEQVQQQQQQYRGERERDDEVVTSPTAATTAVVGATSIAPVQQQQLQRENMISSATNTNTVTAPTNSNIPVKVTTNVDDSAIQAIHLRQQELLRCSLQNDCIMDVQNGTLTMEQLMQSPLFTMSGLSAATTIVDAGAPAPATNHQHVHNNNNGSNDMNSNHAFSDNRMMMSVMSATTTTTGTTTNDALDELFGNVTGIQNKDCHFAENHYGDNQLTTMMMMSYLQDERCTQEQQRDHAVIQRHDTTTQSYDNVMELILSSRSQIMVLNHHDTEFSDNTNNRYNNEYHNDDHERYKHHDFCTTNITTGTTTKISTHDADDTDHPSDFLPVGGGGASGAVGEDLDFLFNENSLSSLITTNMNLNDDDDDYDDDNNNNNNHTDINRIDPPLYDISM